MLFTILPYYLFYFTILPDFSIPPKKELAGPGERCRGTCEHVIAVASSVVDKQIVY